MRRRQVPAPGFLANPGSMRATAVSALAFVAALSAAAPARAITRCSAVEDAASWVAHHIPYSQSKCWKDPLRNNECYRTDCSGLVSANWDLGPPGKTTLNFHAMTFNKEIAYGELEQGDALVYRASGKGHVMLFKKVSSTPGFIWVYEEPGTGKFAQYVQKSVSSLKSKGYHPIRYNKIEPCTDPPPPNDQKAVIELGIEVEDIEGQPDDFPPSDDVYDLVVGQQTIIHVMVSNSTASTIAAKTPTGMVSLTSPDLAILEWHIYDNYKDCPTEWCLNDADTLATNPAHANPPNDAKFYLNAISPGETKRLDLRVEAKVATTVKKPELRFYISHVDNVYEKAGFDAKPNNVGGFQTFNGGDLKFAIPLDIHAALPEIPDGVRRPIVDLESYGEWKFGGFFTLSDAKLMGYELGTQLPAAPELVKADDGSADIWLIDSGKRRHIPNMQVAEAWQLDVATATVKPKSEIDSLAVGPDVRAYPFLVKGSAEVVYVMDDPLEEGGRDGGITDASGDEAKRVDGAVAGDGGPVTYFGIDNADDASGCACRTGALDSGNGWWTALLLATSVIAVRGRRLRRLR